MISSFLQLAVPGILCIVAGATKNSIVVKDIIKLKD
jgi:hypothetical protein